MLQSPDGSFRAWITIDGVVTPEYSVETSADGKTVTCWIASELGKQFAVHWTNMGYPAHTQGDVKMDGVGCGGKIAYGHLGFPRSCVKDGVPDGTTLKPFVFSGLTLSDDDALLGGPSYEHLGLIELIIAPIQILNANVPCSSVANLSNLQVHERSKKAVTQQITLAAPIIQKSTFVKTARLAADLITFTFKYRPLDILQANGIAPASPGLKRQASDEESTGGKGKSVLSDKRNLLSTKRVIKEEKKPRVKEEKKPHVKSEDDVIDLTEERPNKKVKRERPFKSGEVIDLT